MSKRGTITNSMKLDADFKREHDGAIMFSFSQIKDCVIIYMRVPHVDFLCGCNMLTRYFTTGAPAV